MIHRYKYGYPGSRDDLMDSAVRMSILVAKKNPDDRDKMLMVNYEKDGLGFRCPVGSPADNPNNLTRDNLTHVIFGLWNCGYKQAIRRLFWSHAFRFFFTQSIERDKPGSRKYVYPHSWYKDSDPNTKTATAFNNVVLDDKLTSDGLSPVVIEKASFNYRDLLSPGFVWYFMTAADFKWRYLFFFLKWFHLTEVKTTKTGELNQIMAQAVVCGTKEEFKKSNPAWQKYSWSYWYDRGETEYAVIWDEVFDAVSR